MDPAVRAARAALAKNPLNVGAWNEVLRLSVREPPEKRREVFEEYLELFPTRASVWRQYIEFEIAHKHYEQTKELFKRCLMKCPFIGLWELYIKFLEDTNTPREEMLSALKLAVDTMKPDIDSYSLWRKYINLFKNEPTDGKRPHEVSRLTMDTRSLYQTSIALPHRGVDKIWKEYLDWETNMNQAIASKYTKEKGPLHSNARAVTAKIEQLCRRLRKDFPSLPPEMRDGILAEQQRLWEQLVAYERSNPLKLDHDHLVVERVYFVYRQYLLCFNRYPTVWYEAAMYLHDAARAAQTKGDTESAERWQGAANALLAEGRTACPADLILHFAHADLLETQANIPEAKKIYKSLLAQPDLPNATLVYVQFLKHTRRTEGVKAAREVFKAARSDDRVDHHVYTASAMMELARLK
ncbi:hypothetical protein PTSG_08065 [Salpingoeca rosetta]|uniref:Suppressor of forked domain-containing protein n=1 Tax=Salpingoeca rosetta (strain ATCC 50818 / BSB-021) TaxID=946362 RepID=F2UHW5_SALR5|nr:uncharacterized protein PTSG_08065 [Salpingoeca rosetta]EGD76714.1 hypothetical protein PTSG_08065 [Salpingoeca rosetta]|eukprot:XP_004991086.1 hypothetical protein PTSG_08065 [Salpingoeca rosetta]